MFSADKRSFEMSLLSSPRGFAYKVPKTAVADQMAPVYLKWWDLCDCWPPVHLQDHQSLSQCRRRPRGRAAIRRPAHKALNCQVSLSVGRPPSSQWHRRLGRPHNRWVDQIRSDNNLPLADLWRRAVSRGHRRAMLQPLPAKQWQQPKLCWWANRK